MNLKIGCESLITGCSPKKVNSCLFCKGILTCLLETFSEGAHGDLGDYSVSSGLNGGFNEHIV